MDKTQMLLAVIAVLVAVTAACSAYNAFMQNSSNDASDSQYDELKEAVAEIEKYGGNISSNSTTYTKSSSLTFSTDDHNVIIKGSNYTKYIPFEAVNSFTVLDH